MRSTFGLSVLLLLAGPASPQSRIDPVLPKIEKIIEKGMKDWEVPGCAIGIVENDKIVYLRGFGLREIGKPDPVTPRTVFALASCSKAFTAACCGLMVDEEKMRWDDSPRKFIPGFALRDPIANETVAIRDLLNHMTGVPRHDELWYRTNFTQKEILEKIPRLSYSLPIRTRPQYNNIMYMAAGVCAGNAAGTTWERMVTERIFQPLGMKDTGPTSESYLKAPDRATPHAKNDKLKVVPVDFLKADSIAPAGGVNSNAADMCQWIRLLLNEGTFEGKALLKDRTVREILRPQIIYGNPRDSLTAMTSNSVTYSMGWAQKDLDGQNVEQHNGRLNGFSSSVTLLPRLKIGFVMLTNSESAMPYVTPTAIVDAILGRKSFPYYEMSRWLTGPDDWDKQKKREAEFLKKRVPGTNPARKLEDYVGKYTDPVLGTVDIQKFEKGLKLKWQWHEYPLEHLHFETFYGFVQDGAPDVTGLETVTFHYNNKGEIVSLNLGGLDEDTLTGTRFVREK